MKKLLLILSLLLLANGYTQLNTRTFNCYFDFNKADFPTDSTAQLLRWMDEIPGNVQTITLSGFTDSVGLQTYNFKLADQRLKTIVSQLNQRYYGKIKVESAKGEVYKQAYGTSDSYWRKVKVEVQYQEKPPEKTPLAEIIEELPAFEKEVPAPVSETPEERLKNFGKAEGAVRLDVQFVGGLSVYLKNPETDIALVATYLQQNPDVKAFIRGHVCCENDFNLSGRRAKAVYEDLVRHGVSRRRLTYQGFGNTIPVADESTEAGMQQNRRVDVIFSSGEDK